jgi:D-beta-D-heptose 7-phosphate kinase/D-beta-D-heptose 1-phosphate adenosyltransferase
MAKYYIVSGGFDPIHEGHIENIKESRLESDGVVALLNSDEWLCRKKGHNFMSFYTRSVILENIKGVIDVMGFDDSDGSACDGLRRVREKYPHDELVFAKGGDRTADNIPEIGVCKETGIEIKYNVGFAISGNQKPNSSSWLLKDWVSKCSAKGGDDAKGKRGKKD